MSVRFRLLFLLISLLGIATACAGQVDSLARVFYEEGKAFYYEGQYEKARQKFLDALAQKKAGSADGQLMKIYIRLGKNEAKLRIHPKALSYLETGKALATDLFGPESLEVADFLYEMADVYSQMYQPDKAESLFKTCLSIYTDHFEPQSREMGNMYMNFGIEATKMARYKDAERYFLKTRDIFQQVSEPESEDFNRIYSNLGYLYRKMGNYERSIEYGTKALEIKLLHYPEDHPSVAKYHRNIGRAYEEMGEAEKALPYMQRAVEIAEQSLGTEHSTTGGSYGELGNTYAELGEYEQALELYRKANAILEKTLPPTHPYLVGGYFNIGRVFEDMGDYPKALSYYEDALQRFRRAEYTPLNLVAQTQRKIAEMYAAAGNMDQAIKTLQEAMQSLVPAFMPENNYSNPPIEYAQNQGDLLEILRTKGALLDQRYRKHKRLEDLEFGFQTLILAVELIERIKEGYFSESDRQLLNERMLDVYELAVRQAYELYELSDDQFFLEQAFRLTEKSKSGILWQSLNAAYALEAAGVPQAVLDSLQTLRSEIASLEESLYEGAHSALYTDLVSLKIRYEEQIRKLETYNPRYYQLKYATPNLDVESLAAHLPNKRQALISYFYDRQHLYIFLLRKNGLQGLRVPLDESFENLIRQLRDAKAASLDAEALSEYLRDLHRLYGWLIEPVQTELDALEELVIIPHGGLHYVAFEALAPSFEKKDFRDLDYLLRRYTIQYAWSADFWLHPPEQANGTRAQWTYLGFAPEFGSPMAQADYRADLVALPHAIPEVEEAASLFSGQSYTGSTATESRFRAMAAQTRILHLATHGLANDEDPLGSGLWFAAQQDTLEDGYLNALEIYNSRLSAELVVMSACNTGYGKLVAGEGVMSLGRAFSYAGCESVMMSLWLANDQSTSSIVTSFFDHAANGAEKHHALRQAKLDYLEGADALTAHPYFWANLVVIGDMSPLEQNHFPWFFPGAIGLVIVGGILIVWRRKLILWFAFQSIVRLLLVSKRIL